MAITYSIQYLSVNLLVHITFFVSSKMVGFEPTKRHMREALLFYSNLLNMLLKIIAYFRRRTLNMLYLRERAEISLDGLKVVISTLKTKNVQDSRKNLKIETWRHYSLKTAVRSLQDHLVY